MQYDEHLDNPDPPPAAAERVSLPWTETARGQAHPRESRPLAADRAHKRARAGTQSVSCKNARSRADPRSSDRYAKTRYQPFRVTLFPPGRAASVRKRFCSAARYEFITPDFTREAFI